MVLGRRRNPETLLSVKLQALVSTSAGASPLHLLLS